MEQLTGQERLDVLAKASIDARYYAELMYPEVFYAQMNSIHDAIFDLIDNSDKKKKCIAGPRGVGKTSICEAIVKRKVDFRGSHFVGYLSHSETNSEFSTEAIKMDLLTSERRNNFGFLPITESVEGIDPTLMKMFQFSKKAWVANGDCLLLPRGAGQQVRGLKWRRWRPDTWVVDDLEDDEQVESEMQRDKLKRWFFGAFLNTINRYTGNYEIIYIDTIKHEDALITHILDDPDWDCITLSSYTTDEKGSYKTVDPLFLTQEDLDGLVASHRRQGIMDVFAREFGAQPTSREDNEFSGNIKYYSEKDKEFNERLPYMETLVIVDPSKKKKMKNAETGYLVFSIDTERRAIYIRTAYGRRLHQDEMIEEIFKLCDQYHAKVFGVEVTGLEEHITYPINNSRFMLNKSYLEFIELKARTGGGEFAGVSGGKVGRARSAMPLFRQGLVYLNEVGTADLEGQMLGFPRPKRWDVLDCLGYVPQMLDIGLRYMQPARDEDEPEDIEAEYKQLEMLNEPPLDNSWKTI